MKISTKLIALFILLIVIKVVLASLVLAPSAFSDNYSYIKMARSIFYFKDLSVHGSPTSQFPPLYPFLLSPAYIFNDMELVFFFMKVINAILSSLIILPAYLIARQFLTRRDSILLAILVGIIPSNFSFTPYIMSENLFYTVFLFSIYFLYKSFKQINYKHSILAGIFIGLFFLTRVSGIVLFAVPMITFIMISSKDKVINKKLAKITLIIYIISSLIIISWLIRNGIIFGFTFDGLIGAYKGDIISPVNPEYQNYPLSLINWILLYTGFLLLASGVIFFIALFLNIKTKMENLKILSIISLIIIFLFILVAANHSTGFVSYKSPFSFFTDRPLGRYIDTVTPLIIILGFIGLKTYDKNKLENSKLINRLTIAAIFILLISTQLTIAPLFPVNNLSLTHVGLVKSFIEFILFKDINTNFSWAVFLIIAIIFLILGIIPLILKKLNLLKIKILYPYFIILFLSVGLVNYSIAAYNSYEYWYKGDQMQLGIWFNNFDKKMSNILFDERDCTGKILKNDQGTLCEKPISKFSSNANRYEITIMGIWMNDNIRVGNIDNPRDYDFIVSKHDLTKERGLEKINSRGDFSIYKVGK